MLGLRLAYHFAYWFSTFHHLNEYKVTYRHTFEMQCFYYESLRKILTKIEVIKLQIQQISFKIRLGQLMSPLRNLNQHNVWGQSARARKCLFRSVKYYISWKRKHFIVIFCKLNRIHDWKNDKLESKVQLPLRLPEILCKILLPLMILSIIAFRSQIL